MLKRLLVGCTWYFNFLWQRDKTIKGDSVGIAMETFRYGHTLSSGKFDQDAAMYSYF